MKAPRVSVVVIARDQEWCVRDAIRSVLGQTFRDFELILVDDASEDRTAKAMLEFARQPNVRMIRKIRPPEGPVGPAAARNHGFERARGEFLLPLDGDDMLHPDCLAETVAAAEAHPSASVVYTDLGYFGDHGGVAEAGAFTIEALSRKNGVPVTAMIRADAFRSVGGYLPSQEMFADYGLWLRLAAAGHEGVRVRKPLFLYRVHERQWTRHATGEERERLLGAVLSEVGR